MQSKIVDVDNLKERFRHLYDLANNSDSGRLVPIVEEMKQIGFTLGLCYKRRLLPSKVCPHRHNRDGAIIDGKDAMNIWNLVDQVGVSVDLWRDAQAFEEPDDRPNESAYIQLAKCEPTLTVFQTGQVEVASVACSHWTQALLAALVGKVR